MLQRIRGLKVAVSTAEIVIGIGEVYVEVEVDIVDDEVEVQIEEKHGITGDTGDKVGANKVDDEIREIHDVVGEGDEVEVEVYVGVAIDA